MRLVTEGVFSIDPPALLGARCGACGEHHFPRARQCPYCGAENVEPVELSEHGTLWGWTTVVTPPPGYLGEVSFGFGIVELPEGLRVITRLAVPDDTWKHGQPMHLRVIELGSDANGEIVTSWEFTP